MNLALKSLIALITLVITGALFGLMLYKEFNCANEEQMLYFGILCLFSFIPFLVLTKNDDNEKTDPSKEKLKK